MLDPSACSFKLQSFTIFSALKLTWRILCHDRNSAYISFIYMDHHRNNGCNLYAHQWKNILSRNKSKKEIYHHLYHQISQIYIIFMYRQWIPVRFNAIVYVFSMVLHVRILCWIDIFIFPGIMPWILSIIPIILLFCKCSNSFK